jgi:DNA modification methylase
VKVGPFDVSGSYVGDCRDLLTRLPDACVQCCVTSPPYWGLRDYGVDGQLGLEATPEAYVDEMVGVFEQVRRVLKDDGVLWLNLGDSYATNRGPNGAATSTLDGSSDSERRQERWAANGRRGVARPNNQTIDPKNPKGRAHAHQVNRGLANGLKHKDLVGIPWMVAFALRSAGWYLRADIVWQKDNPMPESVTDRPTKAHEYIFLLSKAPTYYYNADAIKEPARHWGERRREGTRSGTPADYDRLRKGQNDGRPSRQPHRNRTSAPGKNEETTDRRRNGFNERWDAGEAPAFRNKRSVWRVPTRPYADAHFATFPPELIVPCVLAGSRAGDLVLDPFFGSGTTGQVAEDNGRLWLGFDLNPAYADLQKKRTAQRGLCFKEG